MPSRAGACGGGTPAHVSDVSQTHKLLHGEETEVLGDAGRQGVEKREERYNSFRILTAVSITHASFARKQTKKGKFICSSWSRLEFSSLLALLP